MDVDLFLWDVCIVHFFVCFVFIFFFCLLLFRLCFFCFIILFLFCFICFILFLINVLFLFF
jgi:hypothetical protein